MKVQVPADLGNISDEAEFRRFSSQAINSLVQAVNGQLEIGGNVKVFQNTYVSPANVSVGIEIKHDLNTTSPRWIIVDKFNSADFYRAQQASPSSFTLFCTAGLSTFTILVF